MQGDDVVDRARLAARLAPTYWVAQLPDLMDGDRRLQESERRELARMVTAGLPRAELRATLGVVGVAYLVLAVGACLLAALALNGPSWPAVATTALALFCIGQALLGLVRWLLPFGDDDSVVVWHPLITDLVVAGAAVTAALLIAG